MRTAQLYRWGRPVCAGIQLGWIVVCSLAGCVVGPDFVRPVAQTPVHWTAASQAIRPDGARPDSTVIETVAELGHWWQGFGDPTLSALLERTLAANLDLRAAVLRIEEARAQRAVAGADRSPKASANASWTRSELSASTPTGALFGSLGQLGAAGGHSVSVPNPYSQYQIGIDTSWEIDLFGRVRRTIERADATIDLALEDQHAVRVILLADAARAYLELRGGQARRATVEQNIASTGELLALAQERRAAGLASVIDVSRSLAQQASAQAQLPQLELAITVAIADLARLMDEPPGALRGELAQAAPLPALPAMVAIGLPADMIRRRPDIRRAEAALHAATAAIGIAVADVYPRLVLGASGGFQSQTAGALTQWVSRFGALGPAFAIPVFDRGRWATVRLEEVHAQQAALAFAATVLTALHEVEDARSAYEADQDHRAWLDAAASHSREAWQLVRRRYRLGLASYIDVLDAERSLQQAQLALDTASGADCEDLVRLYRALGGGWEGAISP